MFENVYELNCYLPNELCEIIRQFTINKYFHEVQSKINPTIKVLAFISNEVDLPTDLFQRYNMLGAIAMSFDLSDEF